MTVGLESCADHSLSGASNAISTPSKPCRSSSRLSSALQRLVEVGEHRVERDLGRRHSSATSPKSLRSAALRVSRPRNGQCAQPVRATIRAPPVPQSGARAPWTDRPSAHGRKSCRSAARISSWKCSKSASSVSRPSLPYSERDRAHEVAHRDRAAVVGGLERGGQRAVADRAARELELRRRGSRGRRRRRAAPRSGSTQPPDPLAVVGLREREVDHEVEPAQERVVDVAGGSSSRG